MKRRHFVLASLGTAGALAVGWTLMPVRQRLTGSRPLATAPGESAFNGYLKVGSDDRVVVVVPKCEMGQGAQTGLAMVLADELDADWSRVSVEHSGIDPIYNNLAVAVDGLPFHPDDEGALHRIAAWVTAKSMREMGLMMTGGSSSLKDLWWPMRQAGASARAMFVAAAAQEWGVPARELRVASGLVSHAGSGRSARFGALAAAAARQPLPAEQPLKTPDRFTLIGRPLPRLDARPKGDGSARFGIDLRLPGLLHATVRMSPTLGGKVASFDAAKAKAMPGVRHVVQVDGHHGGTAGVAVVADTPWHALQALRRVDVVWDEQVPAAAWSTATMMEALAKALDRDDGHAWYRRGDVDAALAGAASRVDAEYRAPLLAHATLEPQNCTVQLLPDGRAKVWAPTQVPGLAQRAAALALGIPAARVEVEVTWLGGGFGRRLDVDFVGQAAAIAKAAGGGAPVQTFWTREQDQTHDFYRPAAVARFSAGLDAQGRVVGWRNVSASQSIVPQVIDRLFGIGGVRPDKTTAEGAYDQPYEWPAARIAHERVELPLPVGFWRSVGHSHQAFFVESFLDELAHAAKQDPVAFRAALLQGDPRHRRHLRVLQRAAALAGWGTPLPPAPDGARVARGVALHQSFGSVVAQVAEVSVGAGGTIRVHRVHCVVDCGCPVNPNLIRQQMESGVAFGLGAALHGGIDLDRGRVVQTNFHDAPLLRIDACPEVRTEIIASDDPPEGVGEPGVPPVAPAVANALFALTGQRLRSLPLKLAPPAATAWRVPGTPGAAADGPTATADAPSAPAHAPRPA